MNFADEDKVNDSTTPQDPHPNTTMTNALKTYGWLAITALWPTGNLSAQTFAIETVNDSLNYLTLKTDSTTDRWTLAYPVYRLETGDVDGDGRTEALVAWYEVWKPQLVAVTWWPNIAGRVSASNSLGFWSLKWGVKRR